MYAIVANLEFSFINVDIELRKLDVEEAKANARAEETKIVRAQSDLYLLKRKMAAKGVSSKDTSTIHTPVAEVVVAEASVDSTEVVIEGQPSSSFCGSVEKLKTYAGYFRSVVKSTGWDISFHPSPNPTQVKLLGRGCATVICSYTCEGMKNAYCALIYECDSNPDKYIAKHSLNQLVTNYYRDGSSTPPHALLPETLHK